MRDLSDRFFRLDIYRLGLGVADRSKCSDLAVVETTGFAEGAEIDRGGIYSMEFG
jgi:hypothetical protein